MDQAAGAEAIQAREITTKERLTTRRADFVAKITFIDKQLDFIDKNPGADEFVINMKYV